MSSRSLRVPIFPLAGALLFPRAQLPLHIFEPRYREMIQPSGPGDDKPPVYPVGCLGEIVGVEEMEDGRFNIVLLGLSRFRLLGEMDLETPYRVADVDPEALDDSEPEPLGLAQRAEVEREARRLGDALGLVVDWAAVSRLHDEMLVNAIAQVAPFDVGAKQALLEAVSLADRADLLVQLMQFQRMAVTGGVDVEPTLQ
jgi:Lon protease-like protein